MMMVIEQKNPRALGLLTKGVEYFCLDAHAAFEVLEGCGDGGADHPPYSPYGAAWSLRCLFSSLSSAIRQMGLFLSSILSNSFSCALVSTRLCGCSCQT